MLIHKMIVISDKKNIPLWGICVGRNLEDVLKDTKGLKTVENLALKN